MKKLISIYPIIFLFVASCQTDETYDVVAANTQTTTEGLMSLKEIKWNAIENFYANMAGKLNTDDKNISTTGMTINGKFNTWKEAKAYYTANGKSDELEVIFRKVQEHLKTDNDKVIGPDLQVSNPTLYKNLIGLRQELDDKTAKLLIGWEKTTKVYTSIIERLHRNKEISGLTKNLMDAYPLFNTRGAAQDPVKLQEKMTTDFANYMTNPKQSGLTPEEAADNFGFYNVADMKKTIGNVKDPNKIAKNHFNNVFDSILGKESAANLFNEVKDLMNQSMAKSSDKPGITSFNMQSFMNNQEQGGASIH